MMKLRGWAPLLGALALAACATAPAPAPIAPPPAGAWSPVEVEVRTVGLGIPGGVRLGSGVQFAGGFELVADPASPFHSLSDLKAHRDWVYTVSDAGVLFRFRAGQDGIEAISGARGGWRVAGESGGVWDCTSQACRVVTAPPAEPIPDSEYRITGMDRDPDGDGFWVVERRFRPPVDVRGRIRRMAADGTLGPVLVELSLPSTVDNFEGIAAVRHGDGVRLYILSDDNNNAAQRTLLLAFDVRSAPTP